MPETTITISQIVWESPAMAYIIKLPLISNNFHRQMKIPHIFERLKVICMFIPIGNRWKSSTCLLILYNIIRTDTFMSVWIKNGPCCWGRALPGWWMALVFCIMGKTCGLKISSLHLVLLNCTMHALGQFGRCLRWLDRFRADTLRIWHNRM